ncbi:MAG: polyprenyl synthetase family protein [Thermotogae bacterium]|nr:polyprenyl synthetase family protein [Thermotogota bacterium]
MKTPDNIENVHWVPEWFESYLFHAAIPQNAPEWMKEMLTYTLSAGGKRFRPALVFSVADDLGLDDEQVKPIAAAVELLHSASLIHDDLPSIDNDDYRRGKLACHKVYGEGRAIVTADVLFFQAFSVISEIEDVRTKANLYTMFSKTATQLGMGELADIEYEGKHPTLESILEMYRMKTGAIFGFCFGAPFAAAQKESAVEETTDLGGRLGIAYQIYDDIKDVLGTKETLGKTPGKDLSHEKSTVLKYVSIPDAKKMADEFLEFAISGLEALGACQTANFLKRVSRTLKMK